jgi:opacity protein-like surface antigen
MFGKDSTRQALPDSRLMHPLFAAAALVLLFSSGLGAQSAEIGLTVGWSRYNDNRIGTFRTFEEGQVPVFLDNGIRIGGRLSFNSWLFLGHELSYAYQRSALTFGDGPSDGMSVHNFYYNFVAHATPQDTPVRPFGTVGVGFSGYFPPGVSSLSGGGDNRFGFNYGGGVKFRLNEIFGIRLDIRDHVTSKPFSLVDSSGRLHNLELSAGLSLLF